MPEIFNAELIFLFMLTILISIAVVFSIKKKKWFDFIAMLLALVFCYLAFYFMIQTSYLKGINYQYSVYTKQKMQNLKKIDLYITIPKEKGAK